MKHYKNKITLSQNNRGCFIIDTLKGCSGCSEEKPKGCYDNCYAANIASRYGFNFSETTKRGFEYNNEQLFILDFKDGKHESEIIEHIKNIDMQFVRIGEMCDPSDDWEHTINVCEIISKAQKPIVIVTKHWNTIPYKLLNKIHKLNICINTSISALDTNTQIEHRLLQYNILKKYCNSILRIVSCDFNKENKEGILRANIQEQLFINEKTIDTIFRPNLNNLLVVNGVIKTEKVKFLKSKVIASIYNKNTYFGHCKNCKEMCGINL